MTHKCAFYWTIKMYLILHSSRGSLVIKKNISRSQTQKVHTFLYRLCLILSLGRIMYTLQYLQKHYWPWPDIPPDGSLQWGEHRCGSARVTASHSPKGGLTAGHVPRGSLFLTEHTGETCYIFKIHILFSCSVEKSQNMIYFLKSLGFISCIIRTQINV